MTQQVSNLLEKRLHALYVLDENQRLSAINEPDSQQIVPRLYIMRTIRGIIWRVRQDVASELAVEIGKLVESEPDVDDFSQPLVHHERYIALLDPVTEAYSGPVYHLPEMTASGKSVAITTENQSVLAENFPFTLEILDFRSPVFAIVEENQAVAICFSARNTDSIAEAGVYTMETHRKRGYAKQLVRDWSVAIHAQGKIPFYSTSWDNKASQSVANALNAIPFGIDFSIT